MCSNIAESATINRPTNVTQAKMGVSYTIRPTAADSMASGLRWCRRSLQTIRAIHASRVSLPLCSLRRVRPTEVPWVKRRTSSSTGYYWYCVPAVQQCTRKVNYLPLKWILCNYQLHLRSSYSLANQSREWQLKQECLHISLDPSPLSYSCTETITAVVKLHFIHTACCAQEKVTLGETHS